MEKIVCLGKNFVEHAQEMNEPLPEKPVLFLKPPSVLVLAKNWETPTQLRLPRERGQVHPECEFVVEVGDPVSTIRSVRLGLDGTLRDEQANLKKKGHPWTVAKVFVDSAMVTPPLAIRSFSNLPDFRFEVDGELRQVGEQKKMRLGLIESIKYVLQFFPLCPGDLIFTGTPKGVGEVKPGQSGLISCGDQSHKILWTE